MERKHYCAYNKTREAFLSLGVFIADEVNGAFRVPLPPRGLKSNECIWISGIEKMRDVRCNDPCDRIYLDADLCVVGFMEGSAGPLADEMPELCSSVLLLPVHTIFASQTQPGDQVLIGTIEEIGAILEEINSTAAVPPTGGEKAGQQAMQGPVKWLTSIFAARDRRRAARHSSLPLMAFYWDGGIPVPHPVPDISRTGLFIKTADRWHPRTLLRVTLQKKGRDAAQPEQTITLQCRVVRADADGVGMAYMLAERAEIEGMLDVGRLASRKELNKFFDQLLSEFNDAPEPDHPLLPFPELAQLSDPGQNANASVSPDDEDADTLRNSHIG